MIILIDTVYPMVTSYLLGKNFNSNDEWNGDQPQPAEEYNAGE